MTDATDARNPTRRQVLTTTAMLGAAAAMRPFGALAATPANAQIDAILQQAVDNRVASGVVAMAATDKAVLYEGATGLRTLAPGGMKMTTDSVFRIASMTKAITSTAAMQLVEQGKLQLDAPVPDIDPVLTTPLVLDGFDASGAPILRPARNRITLRHLLTHSAGFCYDWADEKLLRYIKQSGMPFTASGKKAALRQPLMFEPGEKWEYGINVDWVGQLVEYISGKPLDVYFRDNILMPLGMKDTAFFPREDMRARQANYHQRKPDGGIDPQPLETPFVPEFWAGGGGLYSTAPDYIRFLQALMNGGSLDGARILKPETVALMNRNALGNLEAGVLKTTTPARSNDVNLFPGKSLRWGLAYMINVDAVPGGRSAGSVTWAGIFNTYYWMDPTRKVAGVIMTQVLPFADPAVLKTFAEFEKGVYAGIGAA